MEELSINGATCTERKPMNIISQHLATQCLLCICCLNVRLRAEAIDAWGLGHLDSKMEAVRDYLFSRSVAYLTGFYHREQLEDTFSFMLSIERSNRAVIFPSANW